MDLLLSLFVTFLLIWCLHAYIRPYAQAFYAFTLVLSGFSVLVYVMARFGYVSTTTEPTTTLFRLVDNGSLSTALFIWVMVAAVLSPTRQLTKRIRKNRAELAIMACYLILGHGVHYGFDFFSTFKNIARMSGINAWAVIMYYFCGFIAFALMIPLGVTSYKKVRKKMGGKRWKALQEYAYFFYGLVYIHVLCVYIAKPSLESNQILSLVLYSIIFCVYALLRVRKSFGRKLWQCLEKKSALKERASHELIR